MYEAKRKRGSNKGWGKKKTTKWEASKLGRHQVLTGHAIRVGEDESYIRRVRKSYKIQTPYHVRKTSRGDLAEDGVWNEIHWTTPRCCEYWNGISDSTYRKGRPASPEQGIFVRRLFHHLVQYRSRKTLRLTSMTSRFTSCPWIRKNLISF